MQPITIQHRGGTYLVYVVVAKAVALLSPGYLSILQQSHASQTEHGILVDPTKERKILETPLGP